MDRRNFISLTTLATVALSLPLVKTQHEDYVAWFKKEFGASPYYVAPNNKHYFQNLIGLREHWQSPTPVYRRYFTNIYGKVGAYTQESWESRQKEMLKNLDVLTFNEYKQHIV
jgi:hypothetical protein